MKWIVVISTALVLSGCGGSHEPTAGDLIRSGEGLWRQNDFLSAAALYERAGEKAPDAPEAFYDLALAYQRTKLYDQAERYLDRAQPLARGEMLVRCFLLRGDVEYRLAMAESSIRRVEGLERALKWYRDALAAGVGVKGLSEMARYDVEVVKLQLPAARSEAPSVRSDGGLEQEDVSAEELSFSSGLDSRQRRQARQEEQDW